MVTRRRIPYGPHAWQYGDLWLPEGAGRAVPVVALYHGGFWRAIYTSELMDALAEDVARHGWAAWNVEYRRVGAGGGGGGWPATFDDTRSALAMTARLDGVDPARIVTCGHSAGGHLALWAAWDQASRASPRSGVGRELAPGAPAPVAPLLAVSLAGVLDTGGAAVRGLGAGAVQQLLGGEPEQWPDRYRAVSLPDALPLGVRQLIVHGAGDDVVPPEMSRAYAAAAALAGDDVELAMVDDDHMGMIEPDLPAWAIVTDRIGQVAEGG